MVVKGFDTARTIRSVWVVGSSPKRLWTLATTKYGEFWVLHRGMQE
jgi:hypothetical protein